MTSIPSPLPSQHDTSTPPNPASPESTSDARVLQSTTTCYPVDTRLPLELTRGRRFVAWRYEDRKGQKPAKVPYTPGATRGASSTNPAHWVTFEEATAYARVAGLDGVGRVLVEGDGLVGIDLDNCRDPESGELAEWATAIVRRLDTYTEISPSGQGVKLWAYGSLPPHGRKRGDVEMYSSGRFFTLTGRQIEGTPPVVGYRPDAIAAIHAEIFGETSTTDVNSHVGGGTSTARSDDDVIKLAGASPHQGAKFRRLWAGDTSEYAHGDNDGESEADAALADILAYYSGGDREQIERLFSQSALGAREKWQRADYRRRTIDFVLRGKTRFYGDSIRATTAPALPIGNATTDSDDGAELRARVTSLERALLDRDDLVEYQQSVIRTQRARLDVLERYQALVQDVITRDELECPSDDKVVLIGFVPWLASYRAKKLANDESPAFSLKYGAKVIGMHHKRLSDVLRRWSSPNEDDGAPWYKKVTRARVTSDDGTEGWESVLDVAPWRETPQDVLRVSLAYTPPVLPKKRGGSEEATAHRWGRCTKHPTALVDLRGRCSVDGELLGTVRVTPEVFDALKSRFGISDESRTPPVAVRYLSEDENGISGAPDPADERLNLQTGVSEAPVSLLDYAPPRVSDPPPLRCPAPGCRALELRRLPDGSWRCLKSGHDPSAYVLLVAGGET